jgi:hypothetical protein
MAITHMRSNEDRNVKYWPVLLLSLLPLWAQALEEGERLAPWTLLDQFDQPFTLDNQTQTLLVARSMDAAKLVAAALQDQPKGYLEARHAVFVADIQRMPRLIAKMFAVPAMRDYPYRVMLDRDGRVAPRYPGPVDKVLWLQLKDGQLVGQYEFATAAQLREALEKALP